MDYLFDVFLSHNNKDKEFVRQIARLLRERGLRPWLDEEQLIPGEVWQDKLARGIRESATCAMFLGSNSLGDWQEEELDQVRNRAAKLMDYRITPVLLPGLTDSFDNAVIPPFLENRTGIDYRGGIADKRAFHLLVCSINGNPPGPSQDGADISVAIPGTIISPNTAEAENPTANPNPLQGLSVRYNKGLVNAGTIIITSNYWGDQTSQREKEIAFLNLLQEEYGKDLKKYTSLAGKATPMIKPVYEHKPFQKLPLGNRLARSAETRRFDDAVGEILKLKRAVVLGEPGAGKTTTFWKLAGDLIDKALASESGSLPLLIRLGKWTDENQSFRDFLHDHLGDFSDQLERLLKENRAVLLLDGLNELPAGQRKGKTAEIRQFIDKWPKVTAIISCRQLDYTENELEMDRVEIVPLDPIRIRKFVRGYLGEEKGDKLFWRLAGKEARNYFNWFLEEFKEKLTAPEEIFWNVAVLPGELEWWRWNGWLRERDNPSSLMVMAKNPFMLMMLYSVYDEKSDTLPENRGRLFEIFAGTLFERERVPDEEQKPLADAISLVAYQMQTRRRSQEQGDALTVLPRSEVLKTLDEDQLKIATRASILSTVEEVRFTHQLLQEYFAARHMDEEIKAGRLKAESLWPAEKWWERNNWEETTVLLAGLYSDDCTQIIDWIADANPEVTAMCIKRSGANCPSETLEEMKKRWMPRLTDLKRDKDPRARTAVGRALGMTGLDDRRGVGTILDKRGRELPDIDWIEIPGGDFLYGQRNERRTVGSFKISRYPVTYKQFQVFIDDPEGIRDKRWFEGLACGDEEHQPGEQLFQYDNHPRERVSWYQAVAFSRWLSRRLGSGYDLKRIDQWKVRLPTELEWERAARGLDGRIYPYGDEFDPTKGNTSVTDIDRTSAVGIFPTGASPDGVLDMSGNVWQWCLNSRKSSEFDLAQIDLTTDDDRPLRGGSWYDVRDDARAIFRVHLVPYDRDGSVGLRVVSVVRPPS